MRWARGQRFLITTGLCAALVGCRDPTQITLEIRTDFPCEEHVSTGITVSAPEADELPGSSTSTQNCADQRIGSIAVVPGGDEEAPVKVRVVTSLSSAPCEPPAYGPTCIVARRQLRFVANTPLSLPIDMRNICAGVICDQDATCVEGVCVSANVDPNECTKPEGCGEEILEPPQGTGGAGGAGGAGGGGVGGMGTGGELPTGFGGMGGGWVVDTQIGLSSTDNASLTAAAPAPNGGVYVAGHAQGDGKLGDGPTATGSFQDGLVGHVNSNMSTLWTHRFSSGQDGDEIPSIASDAAGNVYVLLEFRGTPNVAPLEVVAQGGQRDILVARLSPTGTPTWVWHPQAGGSNVSLEGTHLVEAEGVVYVSGTTDGAVSLTPNDQLTPSGGTDAFVVKLDANNGSPQWARLLGGAGDDGPAFLGVDASKQLRVAAGFDDTFLDGGNQRKGLGRDIAIATLSSETGATSSFSIVGGAGNQDLVGAVMQGNELAVAASYADTLTLAGSTIQNQGGRDVTFFRAGDAGPTLIGSAISSGDFFNTSMWADDAARLFVATVLADDAKLFDANIPATGISSSALSAANPTMDLLHLPAVQPGFGNLEVQAVAGHTDVLYLVGLFSGTALPLTPAMNVHNGFVMKLRPAEP